VIENAQGEIVELDGELRVVATLKHDKAREREGQYVVEGVRAVETLLELAGENVLAVYEIQGTQWKKELLGSGRDRKPCRVITTAQMAEISHTKTAQGLLAVAAARSLRVNWDLARRVTLVDGVQDPGNLGAMFRTSAAFGFDAMVLGKGTVDPWNPRVARGSSGLVASVPFESGHNLPAMLEFLRSRGFTIVGTSPHGKETIDTLAHKLSARPGHIDGRVAFLVGNEGKGTQTNLLDQCDLKLRITMAPGVESLNVAVAHGILCSRFSALA
jgi:TrmH family RNA methyltransferase